MDYYVIDTRPSPRPHYAPQGPFSYSDALLLVNQLHAFLERNGLDERPFKVAVPASNLGVPAAQRCERVALFGVDEHGKLVQKDV